MDLNIRISDDRAAAVKAQAQSQGLTVERWAAQIVEEYAQVRPASFAHLQKTGPQEWARRFHEWAESHDRTTPLLADDVITRESIYPDRF